MKRIILCGGSGYIGTKLTQVLLEETDYDLVIIDRLYFKLNSNFKNKYYNSDRVEFHQKDIQDLDFMSNHIHEGDYVVNLAALVGEPLCKIKPVEAVSVNYDAAVKLSNLCKKIGTARFIQLSTCSNYGQAKKPVDEDGVLLPTSLYAETKVNLEKYLLENIPNSLILRCSTAYGLSIGRMRFDLLISEFIKEAWISKEISVFMPHVHRPLVHIYDISQAIKLCIESDSTISQVYNVGSNDQNFTKQQIAEEVASYLHVPLKIVEKEDKRDYIVNFDRIHRELGFKTKFNIHDGIKEMTSVLESGEFDLSQSNVQT